MDINSSSSKKAKLLTAIIIAMFVMHLLSACQSQKSDGELTKDQRMAWWREAKFGMFIHWGLYAIPAGVWQGKDIIGVSEWIMRFAKIHVKDYEPLAKQFNPLKFNADEWVKVAKNAGMKYIVITAKHHDGFAMYDTDVNNFNVVDATPFRRNILMEIKEACKKHDIKLGIYYSHVQDWRHPDAWGNDWEFDPELKHFDNYFYNSAKPQVQEILTHYDPDLIWFDTPGDLSKARSDELIAMVRQLTPNCLINGRGGPGGGDYRQMGDNQTPASLIEGDWETPATLNDSWGYKAKDNNWKSTRELLVLLTKIVSKGGNYLLNVGPDAQGIIPKPSVERLLQIGQWMQKYGEAIYGTSASPYPWEHTWGVMTQKPGKLYLHIVDWPKGKLSIDGLTNKVKKAYHLADPQKNAIEFQQHYNNSVDIQRLVLNLPAEAPDKNISVIVLEIAGEPDVEFVHSQNIDGEIRLEGYKSVVHQDTSARKLYFSNRGAENWRNKNTWLSWDFKLLEPGKFEVYIMTSEVGGWANDKTKYWTGGHKVKIMIADQELLCTITDEKRLENIRQPRWSFIFTKAGEITLEEPKTYQAQIKPVELISENSTGLTFNSIVLKLVN